MGLWLSCSCLSSPPPIRTLRPRDEDVCMVTWLVRGRAGANLATSWENKGTRHSKRFDRAEGGGENSNSAMKERAV